MTHTLHPLAEDYLERLDRAAAHLPRARRRELVDDIEAHLLEALSPEPSDAEVREVLARLGAPEEIVDAEAPRPPRPARPAGRKWGTGATVLFAAVTLVCLYIAASLGAYWGMQREGADGGQLIGAAVLLLLLTPVGLGVYLSRRG
ncbi:hypothetical protein OJ997_06840 [Solirubrobacter phytolaccae]|uniref:Uncharacterized protein n=1 Tax=Solirubrobacter phytolaccae TaxID=1404360 RepID=A0A9X3SA74_9ACTN|nr:hypothetical protein [Solirubrobacter phytolaccae]MDA0180005.1 hypothetical protein [Solirubrobacter phytolaccae]